LKLDRPLLYDSSMARLSMVLRREWPALILGAMLVLLCVNAVRGPHGPADLIALRRHQSGLEAQRARLLAENARLRTEVQKLRSDNHFIEHLIRRQLGWTRPDELVYKFPPSSDAAAR
jgi:cell division protein FtsB